MSTAHPPAHNTHGEHHGEHAHPAHLAHHFDTPEQQFASGKLGMWVFLATELLMFGGLFCAYSVYRALHPEVFLFAHLYLDKIWGGINTGVLIASSFTMAWGVRAAQLGQRGLLKVLLALTFMGGIGFMCIKFVEYKAKWENDIFVGHYNAFNATYTGPERTSGKPDPVKAKEKALEYWQHHADEGSAMAAEHDKARAGHPEANPAAGHTEVEGAHPGHVAAPTTDHPTSAPTTRRGPLVVDPNYGSGDQAKIFPTFYQPVGLSPAVAHTSHHTEYSTLNALEKSRINTFFGIYFIMTGLHGVHVLVGMAIIAWLFFTANRYSGEYYSPVDIGGLYWHLVDLIWIFLFPLLYLIH